MKSILVPTDFSDCAERASETAIQIAKKVNAQINFLHIVSTPVDWNKISLKNETRYPETCGKIAFAKDQLYRLEQKSAKQKVDAKHHLVYDTGMNGIIKVLKNFKNDFIIMGSHGTSGAKEFLIGSNTQKTIRHATVPVLVIKDKVLSPDIKNVIFASDFTEADEKPFLQLLDFILPYKSVIHFLYVNTATYFENTDETLQRMDRFISRYKGNFTANIYNAYQIENGILRFAEKSNADLLALCTEGRRGISRMLMHSITEVIANHSKVPVLSLNVKNK